MLSLNSPVLENFSKCPERNLTSRHRTKQHCSRDVIDFGGSEDCQPPPGDVSLAALDLKKEADRAKTFEKWPVNFMSKALLAENGFYYLGVSDKVRCHFCNIELGNWEEGDIPAVDHERWRSSCTFLRGLSSNIPLARSSESPPPSGGGGQDVCGTYNVVPNNGPHRPAYSLESARLQSFEDWPCRMKQTAAAMADAGFFYTGSGDKTVCHYCGGGLKDWEDDDDPWLQHAQWFPNCHYLRIVKGDDFINRARAKTSRDFDSSKAKTPSSSPPSSVTIPTAAVESLTPRESVSESPTEPNLCKLCFSDVRNTCFVPCGHVVACPKCALSVTTCPVCRQPFTSTMRLYYS